jgi:uncharacterized short protein YbdD (DUF466 family)
MEPQADEDKIPAILKGKYFIIESRKGDKVLARCVNCASSKSIAGSLTANSNFVTHLKRSHPRLVKEYNQYKDECSRARASKLVKKDAQETQNKTRKKQLKLDVFERGSGGLPQKVADELILKFIVNGMHAMRIVETPAFKELVTGKQLITMFTN